MKLPTVHYLGGRYFCNTLCALVLLCAAVGGVKAQTYQSQRMGLAAYNVGINALLGGVGAAINKKPEQTLGNAFLKGLGKGAVGGLLIHQAKAVTYQIYAQEKLGWAWPARITNAIGSSIVQNAAANRGMLDRMHLNLWIVRADYDFKDRQFLLRAVPSTLAGAVYMHKYGSLNFSRSLQTGLFFYDIPSQKLINTTQVGHAVASSIAVGTPDFGEFNYHQVVAHEVMHNLQYEGAVWLNPYFNRIDQPLKERYAWYKTFSRYIYLDFNYLASSPLRLIGTKSPCHLGSFLEKEAQHYAARMYIECQEEYSGIELQNTSGN
ncbi:secreted protein [Flammeovirgaceae bacterium 311]|nr:secreted protein [Flammeovirgaceae bacterium 311]